MENALLIPRPGAQFGPYPERTSNHEAWPFYPAEVLRAKALAVCTPSKTLQKQFLKLVHEKKSTFSKNSFQLNNDSIKILRGRLALEGFTLELAAEAFSVISLFMHKELGMTPYDTQLLAGWLMLDRRLIEMHTGEGKTVAVALTAITGALAGIPVHVITANDYLVERDATFIKPVMQSLGLTVGSVISTSTPSQRSYAYDCDVTYCTAKEITFDYLRDQFNRNSITLMKEERPECLLRGLCMAIIDEADSILIDEARTPLILSEPAPNQEQSAFYRQALFLSAQLKENQDYQIDINNSFVWLTATGQERSVRLASRMGGAWNLRLRREETLCLALTAQHLFTRDKHYLVKDKCVYIIDETTGRIAENRKWSRGLQQLIEIKEGCPPTEPQKTSAQTTFQKFFARYLRLSGISGTLSEAANELLAIYGLPVSYVPLRFPSLRVMSAPRFFSNYYDQWQYVINRVIKLHSQGKPILIGTNSVTDSESLSQMLTEKGVRHSILNARFNAEEAEIVANAGQKGAVTVATNMAGRGTDISLGEGIAALGGLHIIACQNNSSRRIDRQLYGRCARQGDPGTVEHLYCMEDQHWTKYLPAKIAFNLHKVTGNGNELSGWLARCALFSQHLRERYGRQERWFLFFHDRLMVRQLAFAGKQS